jgi:hypothetical protein
LTAPNQIIGGACRCPAAVSVIEPPMVRDSGRLRCLRLAPRLIEGQPNVRPGATGLAANCRSNSQPDNPISSPGAKALIASACSPPLSSVASASLIMRWRSIRDFPRNRSDTTRTRKWLSPVPGELRCPACNSLSLVTSSRAGRNAFIRAARILASTDIDDRPIPGSKKEVSVMTDAAWRAQASEGACEKQRSRSYCSSHEARLKIV